MPTAKVWTPALDIALRAQVVADRLIAEFEASPSAALGEQLDAALTVVYRGLSTAFGPSRAIPHKLFASLRKDLPPGVEELVIEDDPELNAQVESLVRGMRARPHDAASVEGSRAAGEAAAAEEQAEK